jgi:cysteine synthase A
MASVKDRLALGIISKAERDGVLIPGKSVIVESTSGNTGIALAQLGCTCGYRVVLTMPETMSLERRCLLKILGAELVLTPAALGMKGAIAVQKKLLQSIPNAVNSNQFGTKYNAEIHFETTGPEIWKQTAGKIDYIVAGVGTGGTITGIGRFLRSVGSKAKIVAVEPAESPVISGGQPGPHKIAGIGAGFVPEVLDKQLLDEVILVHTDEAIRVAQAVPRTDGVFCGFSGGANIHAALKIAERPENEGKLIVAIIPSFGERYLSSALFQSIKDEAANMTVTPLAEVQELLGIPVTK